MSEQVQNESDQKNDISVNANSSANAGNNNTDENGIYSGNSTLQTPEEFEADKHGDHSQEDNSIIASGVDDLQSNSDGAAATDRAGTAERKPFGDTELNKGLEAQAQDVEGV